jgi:hypothetical protein
MRSTPLSGRSNHRDFIRSKNRRSKLHRAVGQQVEKLEQRQLLSVTWTGLSASGSGPSDGGGMMMLLPNGKVLVQDGSNPPPSSSTFLLSPQTNTGSYVNGAWSGTGNMNESRLFFSTVTLPDGRIFGIGGEYPKFSNTAEIYDPTTGVWTPVDPIPTPATNVDLSGAVTGASNSSPITISTPSTAQLKNGMQVTISGVNGNTAANGTFTVANLGGSSFDLVGSSGNGSFTSSPNAAWNSFTPQFGDDPLQVLPPDATHPLGQVLAGYFNGATTYRFDPNAPAGSQWTTTAGGKLHNDRSDEEAWVKLKDGSILSYDVFSSMSGTFKAQRYIPSLDKWVDASSVDPTNPPSVMSDPATPDGSGNFNGQGAEMGPGFLLSNGNVVYFGANGNTAYYNPTTDKWSAGPAEPVSGGNTWVGTDDPGAVLPNGDVLIALSPLGNQPADKNGNPGGYSFPSNSNIYEFNPSSGFTDVSPGSGGRGGNSIGHNAFTLNMVVLPTGQVLLSDEGNSFQVFTEDSATGPQNDWRPTVTNVVSNGDGTFTLNGTQLNGIDEGANYGDDNESASNYPLIRFTDSSGNVSYGRTFNWSSTGVATGATPVSTEFVLPSGHSSLSDFDSFVVVANGIPSLPVPSRASPNVAGPGDQNGVEGEADTFNLGSFIDPDGSPWQVQVNWGDGVIQIFNKGSDGSLGTQVHTYAEEGSYTATVTVTDSTSLSGSANFHVSVSDPAVIASPATIFPVEGEDTGPFTVATFTDPGGPEALSDYGATIDWGDGATTTGDISLSGGVFSVNGDHVYAEESAADHPGSNPYAVTVTITHESTTPQVAHSSAVVSDPAVTPAGGFTFLAVEGVPSATQTVATFTDPGSPEGVGDYSAMIDWGDGTAPSLGTITQSGTVYTVSGSHTYATGLGLPDDFGNTFCDANAPSYHKPIIVSISHESAPLAQAVSDAKISLPPASAHLAGGSLIVVGTTGNDQFVLNPVGNTGAVNVMLNSVSLGQFSLGAGGRVIVAAMDGNDDIQVAGGVRLNTVLYGGPGNDRIKGGGGQNIEVGCEGNDSLTGGNQHDLLIGGAGSDDLNGVAGGDIIVSGIFVDSTHAEDDKYSDLVSALNGGPIIAIDDGAQDILQGASGSDTFYYHFQGGGITDIVHGKTDTRFNI